MKMDPEIKARWVAALRSGEYKQGRRRLKEYGGHCCLGVLCDLHAAETGGAWVGLEYMGASHTLPSEVMAWAGLNDGDPAVQLEEGTFTLAEFNDGMSYSVWHVQPRTFAEIADAIEAQL